MPAPPSVTAAYYVQQASGGTYDLTAGSNAKLTDLDEGELMITPDSSKSHSVFPFVIAYRADANGTPTVAAIGSYFGSDSTDPVPIVIDVDRVLTYPIEMTAMAAGSATYTLDTNAALVLMGTNRCAGSGSANATQGSAFKSGVDVAASDRHRQVRILLPVPDGGKTSATDRLMDLDDDCDPVTVTTGSDVVIDDRDDLDAATYAGAPEACDGFNTSCSGSSELPMGGVRRRECARRLHTIRHRAGRLRPRPVAAAPAARWRVPSARHASATRS